MLLLVESSPGQPKAPASLASQKAKSGGPPPEIVGVGNDDLVPDTWFGVEWTHWKFDASVSHRSWKLNTNTPYLPVRRHLSPHPHP